MKKSFRENKLSTIKLKNAIAKAHCSVNHEQIIEHKKQQL